MTDDWISTTPCLGQLLSQDDHTLLHTSVLRTVMKSVKLKMPCTVAAEEATWEVARPIYTVSQKKNVIMFSMTNWTRTVVYKDF